MTFTRRRILAGTIALAATTGLQRPAGAIIIQDSTWRAEGGRPGRERDGFRAHIALANQPQFDSLIAFSEDEGEQWDDASGTWLGNWGGAAYVLSAAHCFGDGARANSYLYRTQGGTILSGRNVTVHPRYNGDGDNRGGFDVAVVRLSGPVTDGGPPPLLYGGKVKVGTRVVIVGFGNRGLGSIGENCRACNWPQNNKTAAENTIDEVMDATQDDEDDEDSGNWLRVTLRPESEGGSRLDGILGGGDSGGSAWMRANGRWLVVGVNTSGGESYGDHGYFANVSGIRAWLTAVVPGLRFTA